jgi:hypothetical protein
MSAIPDNRVGVPVDHRLEHPSTDKTAPCTIAVVMPAKQTYTAVTALKVMKHVVWSTLHLKRHFTFVTQPDRPVPFDQVSLSS